MMLTRRALLSMLAAAAAAAVADPERLLWVPGRKLISIPPAPKAIYLRVNTSYTGGSVAAYYAIEILDQYGKRFSIHRLSRQQTMLRPLSEFPRCLPSPPLPDLVGLKLWPRGPAEVQS